MAFLRNKTVNLLNLHYGLLTLAMHGGGVFFGVYMLTAGLSVPVVLAAYAAILMLRFAVRPLVLVMAKRVGLRPTVIAGAVVMALQYPILAFVHGVDAALVTLCVVAAVGDALYWTAYHAYFAQLGDAEHRGHQTGAREALAAAVGIVAPIAGGWALATLGPLAAFGAVAVVQMLSTLPLLAAPNIPVARTAEGAFRASAPGFVFFMVDGWMAAGFTVVWQIVLFLSLRESFTAFGGAMALAALVAAVAGLALGRHIDAGSGGRAVWISLGAAGIVIVLRAAATTPAMAVAANALGALVVCLYTPTLMTAVYNLAQRSPCPLRFQLIAEGGFDIGYSAACLAVAGMVTLGLPLQSGILLSLGGVVAMLVLLRRYYADLGRDALVASA